MNEVDKTNLNDQKKIRLNKINGIGNYFNSEINQRKLCSKTLSKYVTAFDYIDKVLIVLSATSGGVSIISFTSVVGSPIGIASASFTLHLSITAGMIRLVFNMIWLIKRFKKKNSIRQSFKR